MLVILPFEVPFYEGWDFKVDYVGHPLIEVVRAAQQHVAATRISDKPVIALLPGSRRQEILQQLPVMLGMLPRFPECRFVIAGAPATPDALYTDLIGEKPVLLLKNQTYDILKEARAALVTSGTATLETALFGVPQVVCYRGNPASYWLARKLIKIKYISLVNLIMDRPVVTELIQDNLNPERLFGALKQIVDNTPQRAQMLRDYSLLSQSLGGWHYGAAGGSYRHWHCPFIIAI